MNDGTISWNTRALETFYWTAFKNLFLYLQAVVSLEKFLGSFIILINENTFENSWTKKKKNYLTLILMHTQSQKLPKKFSPRGSTAKNNSINFVLTPQKIPQKFIHSQKSPTRSTSRSTENTTKSYSIKILLP